nr:xenotropic and polytropic retrovirus receptor 1 homolog [Paramormyrops kingsleyae]
MPTLHARARRWLLSVLVRMCSGPGLGYPHTKAADVLPTSVNTTDRVTGYLYKTVEGERNCVNIAVIEATFKGEWFDRDLSSPGPSEHLLDLSVHSVPPQYKVLTTPFHSVGFPDFWLADQLNSLAPLFLDLWSLIWFYACEVDWKDLAGMYAPPVGSLDCERTSKDLSCLIQCFPPWLRFAQCLRNFWDSGNTKPHLLNAGKYSVVFLTITFAGLYSMALEYPSQAEGLTLYLYLWAASACCSVLVAITWDLRIDWGLLQGPDYLREEAVYSKRAYYYCAILADVLLRLAWGVNIILVQMRDAGSATATGILAPLEVIR